MKTLKIIALIVAIIFMASAITIVFWLLYWFFGNSDSILSNFSYLEKLNEMTQ